MKIQLKGFPSSIIQDISAVEINTSTTELEWAMEEMMTNARVMEKTPAEMRQAFIGKKTI